MRFKEAIDHVKIPGMPKSLQERITSHTTCALSDHEIELFHVAYALIDKQLQTGDTFPGDPHLNVAYIDRDDLSILFSDQKMVGCFLALIVYPIHKWRALRMNDLKILTCILEELCHGLWSISDETAVKTKVHEIVKLLYPNITREQLYPGEAVQRAFMNLLNQSRVNSLDPRPTEIPE